MRVWWGGLVLLALALSGCQARPEAASSASPSVTASPSAPSPSAAAAPTAEPPRRYVFPVAATTHYGRYHHDYPAADVFAPCGSRAVAPTDGVVQEVSRTDVWSSRTDRGADRGGLSYTLLGSDGVRYYGSHLRRLDPKVRPGLHVGAGAVLGRVGNTGDAAGIACHLHFGISPACGPGDWWTRRGAVEPYDYLRSWEHGGRRSPVAAVRAWKAEHGCPASSAGVPDP